MINQATADNIRNLNTHITRQPRVIFDPAERRAALAANVDGLCKKHGMTDPSDINAWVRLAMCYLENGRSAATALEETRKSIERVAKQLVELQTAPRSINNLAEHYRNLRFAREAAQQRFLRAQQRRQAITNWLKRGGVAALVMINNASLAASLFNHVHKFHCKPIAQHLHANSIVNGNGTATNCKQTLIIKRTNNGLNNRG